MSNAVVSDSAYVNFLQGEGRPFYQRYKALRVTTGTAAYFQAGNDSEDQNAGTVEAGHFAKLDPGRPVFVVALDHAAAILERED